MGKKYDIKQYAGWVLGSRDYLTKQRKIEDVRSQVLTFMHSDGRLEEVSSHGLWNGSPAQPYNLHLKMTESERWNVVARTERLQPELLEEEWASWDPLSLINWRSPRNLGYGDKHRLVAIKGILESVRPLRKWNDGYGVYPLDQAYYPTLTLTLQGERVRPFIHLGPYKYSQPLIRCRDLDYHIHPDHKTLEMEMLARKVGVIGSVRAVQEKRFNGMMSDVIHISATTIIDLDYSPGNDCEVCQKRLKVVGSNLCRVCPAGALDGSSV